LRFPTAKTIFCFALFLLLVNALPSLTHATTIVVVRSAREIVIGADSKVTDTYGNDLHSQVCKIQQFDNLFVAFEGLLKDNATGFNVPAIAARAFQMKPNATAAQKVEIFTGALASELFVELPRVRANSEDEFRAKLEGQTFLRVVVAGFENNRPFIFVRQFRTTFIARGLGVTIIPDDCLDDCKGDVVTRLLGETEAIEGLTDENPYFWKAGLAAGVKDLINTEIQARSEYVGPPIDLLQITPSGAKWIQKKPECLEVKNPKSPGGRARRSRR